MIYKPFKDINLSMLGLGCMRLPGGGRFTGEIDMEKTAEMVDYALKNGLNYFDTAWGYHSHQSEIAIGEILKKYPRNSFYLATKFPGFTLENVEKKEEIFEEQMKKLQTDYVDFYLFHCLSGSNVELYTDPKYGLMDYILEQKKKGRIRYIGVSVHASLEDLTRFLDTHAPHIDFCQLQLNWLDWDYQDAKAKVELLNKRNIPIWVMEPVRGGKLASLPETHEKVLKALHPEWSIPAWSFRYLQSIPGVSVVLSGMSDMEQLKDNMETFSSERPLNEKEMSVLYTIANDLLNTVPCTACRYCTDVCPSQIDIPEMIKIYNNQIFNKGCIPQDALKDIPKEKQPASCITCRSCEALCPQEIKISEFMQDFVQKTEA